MMEEAEATITQLIKYPRSTKATNISSTAYQADSILHEKGFLNGDFSYDWILISQM